MEDFPEKGLFGGDEPDIALLVAEVGPAHPVVATKLSGFAAEPMALDAVAVLVGLGGDLLDQNGSYHADDENQS